MSFDLKSFLLDIAPTIATGLGGPLAGTAVQALSQAITGKPHATKEEITKIAEKGLTPEQLVAVTAANNEFALAMKNSDIDLVKVNNAHTEAYLIDTQDARKNNASNENVFYMGVVILVTFAGIVGLSLYGSYQVLTGGILPKDPALVAAVFGFIGTLIGYISANAQSVINFYYGSSKSSSDKTQALSDAAKQLGLQVAKQ